MNQMLCMVGVFLAGALAGSAQYAKSSSVLDGSGTRASGGVYANLSAAGQPGGIAESSGGSYVNQAGFLQTFFMKPGLDTDGDGLPDEADQDNDGDSLSDVAEIAGSAFDPMTATRVNEADTDGDGMSDGAESVAGTDPTNPDALLKIVRIARSSIADISWAARSNKAYRILFATTPLQPVTNVLTTVTASGAATAPWYVLTNTVTDATGPGASRVYGVQALP